MPQVKVAKHAGFCFGVRRAVEMAQNNAPAVTLGPLIHNPQAVAQLEALGIRSVNDVGDIPKGAKAVIRSHGVGEDTYKALQSVASAVVDATCPFVQRIHAIAKDASDKNLPLIVVGEAQHPEVRGILGWTKAPAWAVSTPEAVEALPSMRKARIVSQTTMVPERFEGICRLLKARIPEAEICRTICPATQDRQRECVEIAASVDVMIIVGGRASSNSYKLWQLASDICRKTFFIETADELAGISIAATDSVGITAGASTPDCALKEVITTMNDIEKKIPTEETQEQAAMSMEDVEKTLVQLRPGQIVTGTVVQITEDEVCVNVGYKADGLVKKADLSSTDVKVGDEIEVEVVKVNDGEGNVLLSQKNIIIAKAWDEIVAKQEAGEFIEGVGKEAVKGGLLVDVDGIRCFVPAGQLSNRYVEKIDQFVGQTLKLKILEVDKAKKRIVASRRKLIEEEEKAVWENLQVGAIVKGTVDHLADFGAFVDIGGGVEGLVHVTDLSWGHVKSPAEVVTKGQEIEVKIRKVDIERKRISLSYKETQPEPWTVAADKYPVGAIVEGKVARITTFGAFVELEPGLDGLVHISQCAPSRIEKVEDVLAQDQIVRVKVLGVDTAKKRISLSVRQALEEDALNTDIEDLEIPEE